MSGMLINERFVAVFPSLVRAIGSIEAAVILQHMHFNADERGFIRVTMSQVSEETGIGERTVRRVIKGLREEGWVEARRTSATDATLTYQIDHAKVAGSNRANAHIEVAKVATSEPANLAGSSIQNVEEVTSAVGTEVATRTTRKKPALLKRPNPQSHGRHGLLVGWYPSSEVVEYLRHRALGTKVQIEDSFDRFVAHQRTTDAKSTNWDEAFMRWVSQDITRWKQEQADDQTFDDLGLRRGRDPEQHAANVAAVAARQKQLEELRKNKSL